MSVSITILVHSEDDIFILLVFPFLTSSRLHISFSYTQNKYVTVRHFYDN